RSRAFRNPSAPRQQVLTAAGGSAPGWSEKPRNVFTHLVLPIGPVVASQRAPVVERMTNAFARKEFGKAIGGTTVLPRAVASRKMDVAGRQLLIDPGVAEVCDVVGGIVEIEVVVVDAVHEVFEVVDTGHGETALDHFGMFEQGVGGMVGAEGSSH